MTTYFTEASFKFLRGLARHNERAWFLDHKAEYETHVRAPFQRLLTDLAPSLAEISEHYRVDPTPVQRQVRQFIVDNPSGWKAAAHAPAFRKRFDLDDSEMLVRVPKGYPDDFPFPDDLRRRNFVAERGIDDATMLGPRLRQELAKDLAGLAPFVDYLCAALDLEF